MFNEIINSSPKITATVSDDGTFSLHGIQGGEYYIYAQFKGNGQVLTWMIPIEVSRSTTILQDLTNETLLVLDENNR